MDPTKKELYTNKRASGLASGDADLTAAVENFKTGTTNWIGNKIVNNKTLQLHSTGSGGIRELLASLTDDDVYFCGVKAVVNNQQKVFHLGFVGPNTSGMKKGKATMQKNAAFSVIDAHGELWYDCDLGEITEDKLIQDIARLMRVSIEQVQLV